jgi:hypothetical protein
MPEMLVTLGTTLGLSGVAVGAFVWLFRDVIQRTILSKLPPAYSYRILRLIVTLVFMFSIVTLLVSLAGQYIAHLAGLQS